MKKNLLRGLFTACLLIGCTLSASATLFLSENFSYDKGNLYGKGTLYHPENPDENNNLGLWGKYGSNPDNPIQVVDTLLAFEGYPGGVSGKSAQMFAPGSSEDLLIGLDTAIVSANGIKTGSVYYSFLVNVAVAPSKACYSAALLLRATSYIVQDKKSPTEVGKLFFAPIEGKTDKYQLGVHRNASSSIAYASTELSIGTTYLIVVKYEIAAGGAESLDNVSLFINPASYTTEPATADAKFVATATGTGVKSYGIQGFEFRQAGTSSATAPVMKIGALRIADTYADLFSTSAGDGGDGGDSGDGGDGSEEETPTPTITVSGTDYLFNKVYSFAPDVYTEKITISATDLTQDITISSDNAAIEVPSSITKEAAMAKGGAEVTLTWRPTTADIYEATVTIASEGATSKTVTIACYANPSVDDIAGWNTFYNADKEYNIFARLNGTVTLTHIYERDGVIQWVVQDASGGLFIADDSYTSLIPSTFQVGDQLKGIVLYYDALNGLTIGAEPAAAIANAPVEPTVVTLDAWDADKAKYVGKLIRVNDVKLSLKEGEAAFEQPHQYTFLQGEKQGSTSLFAGSDLIDEALPTATIDIIGIARNTSTLLISPRSSEDIIAKGDLTDLANTTAAQLYAAEGTLHLQAATETYLEVFTVAGQSILTETFAAGTHTITLDAGVYLVKANGAVQKLIVR